MAMDRGEGPVLGIIPARGGSKGIPGKNLALLHGRPLVVYTLRAAQGAPSLTTCVVSTDSPEIAAVATRHGGWVPFLRPAELSQDTSSITDVLIHAVTEVESRTGLRYAAMVLLQPTSPLRTAEDIEQCVDLLWRTGAATVVSVARQDPGNFYYALSLGAGQQVHWMPPEPPFDRQNRQDYAPVYHPNGAVYVMQRETLLGQRTIYMADKMVGYVMPPERSIDIDEPWDLWLAEQWLRHGEESRALASSPAGPAAPYPPGLPG
jgi:CMP-N-acetylneuraminic acid synthetase